MKGQYWTGTDIFLNLLCAEKYYIQMGFSRKDVQEKIKCGEISIGISAFNREFSGRIPGSFAVNREGRFLILEEAKE